jgi:alanine racemase
MAMSLRLTCMEVNLANIQANFKAIRKHIGTRPQIFAVVKADAYGHGAIKVSKALIEAGCQRFAVATPDEAIELREAGINDPVLVLGPSPYYAAKEYVHYDIAAACTDMNFAKAMSQEAVNQGKTALLHLKIDTGMGRIGFFPEEMQEVIDEIIRLPGIKIEGLFTHFATADEKRLDFTEFQFSQYMKVYHLFENRGVRIPLRHVCNSAGILHSPEKYLDAVRPGVILYGMWPSEECVRPIDLKPTFEVKTSVALVREVPSHSGIGYGLRYMTRGREKIAVLPIGYADGYSRALSMKVPALIHAKKVPIVGNICMDQMMIDVTGIDDVKVGDEVVLIGRQGNEVITPEEIACARNTINYEVPIMFLKRVPRVYNA